MTFFSDISNPKTIKQLFAQVHCSKTFVQITALLKIRQFLSFIGMFSCHLRRKCSDFLASKRHFLVILEGYTVIFKLHRHVLSSFQNEMRQFLFGNLYHFSRAFMQEKLNKTAKDEISTYIIMQFWVNQKKKLFLKKEKKI